MDKFIESREELRASMQKLFNPCASLDYLEGNHDGEIPDEIRKTVLELPPHVAGATEEIDKIIGPPPAPKIPLYMDKDDLEARLAMLLKGVLSDNQLPEEESHLLGIPGPSKGRAHQNRFATKTFEENLEFVEEPNLPELPVSSKRMDNEDPLSTRNFVNELEIVEILRNHPLLDLLNSPSRDVNDAIPGRSVMQPKVETEFQYERLDRSTDASRLIILQPGSLNDEIKYTLQPLPLSVLENTDDKSVASNRH
jgi:hypothetical protein